MEFVHYDGITLNKIFINCSFVELNGKKFNIINNSNRHERCTCSKKGTEAEGKCETEENILKYSKGELYLYDKRNNLLGVYNFSKNIKNVEELDTKLNVKVLTVTEELEEKVQVIGKFYLKRHCYINLYEKGDKLYIKCDGEDEIKVKEVYNIGNDTIYVTDSGCKLQISTKRHSKWNGIPIGIIN